MVARAHFRQLNRVLCTEQRHLVAMGLLEFAQAALVGHAAGPVHLHQALEQAQANGAVRLGIHLAPEEVGVTAVQQPAAVGAHGHAAVAAGVAGLFMETHPKPAEAWSDGPNAVPLGKMKALLWMLMAFLRLPMAAKGALVTSFSTLTLPKTNLSISALPNQVKVGLARQWQEASLPLQAAKLPRAMFK